MKEIRIGLVGSGWMGKAHSSALADAEIPDRQWIHRGYLSLLSIRFHKYGC